METSFILADENGKRLSFLEQYQANSESFGKLETLARINDFYRSVKLMSPTHARRFEAELLELGDAVFRTGGETTKYPDVFADLVAGRVHLDMFDDYYAAFIDMITEECEDPNTMQDTILFVVCKNIATRFFMAPGEPESRYLMILPDMEPQFHGLVGKICFDPNIRTDSELIMNLPITSLELGARVSDTIRELALRLYAVTKFFGSLDLAIRSWTDDNEMHLTSGRLSCRKLFRPHDLKTVQELWNQLTQDDGIGDEYTLVYYTMTMK